MALPLSGPLSLTDIQTEFGGSNPVGLDEYYRGGAYVTANNTSVPTSGAISISNFYGAVRQFAFTISANLSTPQNLRTVALANGWNGSDALLATLGTNVTISSDTTGSPALTVNGSFPNGVVFINNGYVVGMGGAGGNGGNFDVVGLPGSPGAAGGNALTVSVAITLQNNGTIGGGGGGAGGGGTVYDPYNGPYGWVGGGGGGGRTGVVNSSGGAAGTGNYYQRSRDPTPGSSGTFSSGGSGGQSGAPPNPDARGGAGGTGGDWGTAGAAGQDGYAPPAFGLPVTSGGAGGGAGSAIVGNANITYTATGTRLGSIT